MIFNFKQGCHWSGNLCWVGEIWNLKKSQGNSGKIDILMSCHELECCTISLMWFWIIKNLIEINIKRIVPAYSHFV